MADTTISGLDSTTSPARTGVIPYSDGSTTTKLTLTQVADLIVPIGSIILWSGSTGSIPANWALCNGLNGTPNLQDRFIVGAGSSYAVNGTGGSATASGSTDATVLTTAQMPAHSHTVSDPGHTHSVQVHAGSQGTFQAIWYGNGERIGGNSNSINSGSTGISIAATGGNQGHSHTISSIGTIPPYYALAYIMRIS
jgi:microcystin-dependent protein